MKLQISYDFTDLDKALYAARETAEFADILEVGAPLLFRYGIQAAYEFKKEFPNQKLLVDAKLVDRIDDVIPLLCKSAADFITVLAGTNAHIIKKAVKLAHEYDTKVVLDLIDAYSKGQTANEAQALGVDSLLYHKGHDAPEAAAEILGGWQRVRGNTDLPVFISGRIEYANLGEILELKPQGIVIGNAITRASNPRQEAQKIRQAISNS